MNDNILIVEGFWSGLKNRITSKIKVQFIDSDLNLDCRAVWDTGATHSFVLTKTVKKYNLVGFNEVEIPSRKDRKFEQYRTNLYLSDEVYFRGLIITEYDFSWKEDIVIGMDIIKLGRFFIDNDKNRTHFAFFLSKDIIGKIKKGNFK